MNLRDVVEALCAWSSESSRRDETIELSGDTERCSVMHFDIAPVIDAAAIGLE